MKQELKIEVTKEAYELGLALLEIVKAARIALKDGFQAGQDVPTIVMQSLPHLLKGVEGVDKLPEEAKMELKEFINAWMFAGSEIAFEFMKK